MKSRCRVWCLVTIALSAGCAATPPRADWVADTAAIHRIYREGPAAVEAQDAARYLTLMDDSVVLVGAGIATVRGHAATRELLNTFFAAGRYRAVLSPPSRLVIADSLASAEYTGVLTTYPASGDSTVARNRYVDVLRRQADGSWRLLVHTWQPEVPAP